MPGPPAPPQQQQIPAAPITTQPIPQPPQQIPGIPQPPQQITTFPQPTIAIGPQQQQQQGGLVVSPYPGSFSSFPGLPQGWIVVGVQCGGGGQIIYGSGPGLSAMLGGGNCSAVWGPPTFNPDQIQPTHPTPQPPLPIQNMPIGGPPTPPLPIQNVPISPPPPQPPPQPPPTPCPPIPPCPPCPTRPTIADCNVCGKCDNGKLSGVDSKVAIIPWGIRSGSNASVISDCGQKEIQESFGEVMPVGPILHALSQQDWQGALIEMFISRGEFDAIDSLIISPADQGEIFAPNLIGD